MTPRKPRKRKPLYPTRLRVGDRIEGDGWSAEWDGKAALLSCGDIMGPRRLKNWLSIPLGHDADCACSWCERDCILEQLVAEGAL